MAEFLLKSIPSGGYVFLSHFNYPVTYTYAVYIQSFHYINRTIASSFKV